MSAEQREKIIESLKNPESNIKIAAQILGKLKNQPNRYPDVSAKELGKNDPVNRRRRGIVATEYNIGRTGSAEATAYPSQDYGNAATSPEREAKDRNLLGLDGD